MAEETGSFVFWFGPDGLMVYDRSGVRRADEDVTVLGVDKGVDSGTAIVWPDGRRQILPPPYFHPEPCRL